MPGPIGTPMANPLPTVLVDTDANGESLIIAFLAETKAYLEQKIGNASFSIADADVKHGSRVVYYAAATGQPTGTSAFSGGTSQFWQGAAAGDTVNLGLDQAVNERVTQISVYGRANGTTAWSFKAYTVNLSTGVVTQLGATQTSGTAAAIQKLSITGLTQTIAADTLLVVEWTAGASGNRVYGVEVTFDKSATP